jgi:hypothetical protein
MPTRYGAFTFSARALNANAFRCEIGPGVAASIELRLPLSGRLLAVSVNGCDHTDFDVYSIVIKTTPAEIICHTTGLS